MSRTCHNGVAHDCSWARGGVAGHDECVEVGLFERCVDAPFPPEFSVECDAVEVGLSDRSVDRFEKPVDSVLDIM